MAKDPKQKPEPKIDVSLLFSFFLLVLLGFPTHVGKGFTLLWAHFSQLSNPSRRYRNC